ncbi:MAG: FKBP-type peptidyl-prolyl cis-trans isomerase [Candidatus Cloacimonetes bacterium]|nr:FKBP-type peptidyl-prolyl cis-trans isomerase [Candidatus Cloacimonadota bacterium]
MSKNTEKDSSDCLWRDLVLFSCIFACFFGAYETYLISKSMDPASKRIEKYTTNEMSTFQMDLIQVEEFQQLSVSVFKSMTTSYPKPGDLVKVKYKGMFSNGTRFDSSFEDESYIEFYAGFPGVIQGLSEGILKVPLLSHANIKVPYFLAYGEKSQGGLIPPKSNLRFEVFLEEIVKPKHKVKFEKPNSKDAVEVNDLMIWVTQSGDGAKVSPSSYFYFDYEAFLENGKIINSTFIKNKKEAFSKQNHLYTILKEAFVNRRLGDKFIVKTSPRKNDQAILFQNSNQSFYFVISL